MSNDIDATIDQRLDGMTVIRAHMLLLSIRRTEIRARGEVEFGDFNVGWQAAGTDRCTVLQRLVARVQPFGYRLEKALFEQAFSNRDTGRECSKDLELQAAIVDRAAIQRIDESIRLADAQRNSENDSRTDSGQYFVDAGVDIAELSSGDYCFFATRSSRNASESIGSRDSLVQAA